MKNMIRCLSGPVASAILFVAVLFPSCNKIPSEGGQGTLTWNFSSGILTRSTLDLPDTDAFILTVANSAGEILYKGSYGDSPESMLVNPGTYTIKAESREFVKPEFDAPLFGDEQVAVVKAGIATRVCLDCSQLNCGLRLKPSSSFFETYPDGSLSVSSSDGDLDYGKSSDRTGYFKPGNLSVMINDGGNTIKLLTRNLEAREILTLGISCPEAVSQENATELSIVIDTMRIWTEEEYTQGSGEADGGVAMENAYSVAQARTHAGEKGVWVCGYIVGGDLSSSKNGIKFEPPSESMTCIAIAARSSASEKSSCVSVQLAKGNIRENLNLVEHPELLGRKVYLKGDIEASYYGIPGIKNISEYVIN